MTVNTKLYARVVPKTQWVLGWSKRRCATWQKFFVNLLHWYTLGMSSKFPKVFLFPRSLHIIPGTCAIYDSLRPSECQSNKLRGCSHQFEQRRTLAIFQLTWLLWVLLTWCKMQSVLIFSWLLFFFRYTMGHGCPYQFLLNLFILLDSVFLKPLGAISEGNKALPITAHHSQKMVRS